MFTSDFPLSFSKTSLRLPGPWLADLVGVRRLIPMLIRVSRPNSYTSAPSPNFRSALASFLCPNKIFFAPDASSYREPRLWAFTHLRKPRFLFPSLTWSPERYLPIPAWQTLCLRPADDSSQSLVFLFYLIPDNGTTLIPSLTAGRPCVFPMVVYAARSDGAGPTLPATGLPGQFFRRCATGVRLAPRGPNARLFRVDPLLPPSILREA